jgi:hypothetical protein
LLTEGWAVRGTTRDRGRAAAIEAAGIEAAVADPARPGTVLDLVGDVTVVHWLLGSAIGDQELVEAIHGPRLEALLSRLVDTPVRGFLYEATGGVESRVLESGAGHVRLAARTWRIPVQVVDADPAEPAAWLEAMGDATQRLLS